MTKKRKPGSARKKLPKRDTAGRPSSAPAGRNGGFPLMGGSSDPKRAGAYLDKFMQYELSILYPERSLSPNDAPYEHQYILGRWPEAFPLFRHAMWAYAERVLGLNPWSSTLRSLLVRARSQDPEGFLELSEAIETALPRFHAQRNNVLHQIHDDDLQISARERHRSMVRLYADMYEIDFPLWLLGVLGKAHRTGSVDSGAFGGPEGKVAQGSLVEAVALSVRDTPLGPLLDDAYMAPLRNSIQHNAYEVVLGGPDGTGFALLRDVDSNEEWSAETVVTAVQHTADLMNAAMSACASVENVVAPAKEERFRDYGIVGVNYAVVDGVPHALVAQLWCFRDIDPDGIWLDESEFFVEKVPNGERAGFTSHAFMEGPVLTEGLLGDALRNRNWIRVVRLPVAPYMGMGFPIFEHEASGQYEVVGLPDEHDVPLAPVSELS